MWSAIDVGIVDLEMTSYNLIELLEEQLNDSEIPSVINYLENKNSEGEIPKCYKKHLSKLSVVEGLTNFRVRTQPILFWPFWNI